MRAYALLHGFIMFYAMMKVQKKDFNKKNSYESKILKTSKGEVETDVPRDRDGSFEHIVVFKMEKRCIWDWK